MRQTSRSPKARPEVEAYVVPDGTCFLFDPVRDDGFALDQLGALVWDYCDGQTTHDGIIAEIIALLPDQPEIAAHVNALLETFAAQGLLLPDATPAPNAAPQEPEEAS